MDPGIRIRNLAAVGALGIAASVLVACAEEAISKADFEALSQQMAASKQQIAAKEKEAAELQGQIKEMESVRVLIGAKAMPTPTPAPSPTPLPAGVAPPPPRTAPAAYREAVPFTFYVETLATTSISKYGLASTVPCSESSVFQRGMKLVWRFEVFDVAMGRRLLDSDDATVKVRLPHGEEVTARFSQRAGGRVPDAPWMWSAAWDIPMDYPVGSLDYTLNGATKDGRTFTWKTPALVYPDGSTDSRVKIID